MSGQVILTCSLSFFYFLNFFSKKVHFFMPKIWYIKKLLYLCNTIKHRIINLKLYSMRNLFVNLLTSSSSYGEERHFVKMTLSKIYAEAVYNDFCDKVDLADYCESLTQYNNCMLIYFVSDTDEGQLSKLIENIVAEANKNSLTHYDLKNKLRNLRKGVIVKN